MSDFPISPYFCVVTLWGYLYPGQSTSGWIECVLDTTSLCGYVNHNRAGLSGTGLLLTRF